MKKRLRFLPLAQEGGQTLVEFALTITVTLMLIFGLIEFARAVYTMSVVQWAAQQGARAGIAVESNLQATVEAAVKERLVGLDTEKALITASQPEADVVQVDVTYPFEFVVPMVAPFAEDGSINVQASASMVVE